MFQQLLECYFSVWRLLTCALLRKSTPNLDGSQWARLRIMRDQHAEHEQVTPQRPRGSLRQLTTASYELRKARTYWWASYGEYNSGSHVYEQLLSVLVSQDLPSSSLLDAESNWLTETVGHELEYKKSA